MRLKTWNRVTLLGILLGVLGSFSWASTAYGWQEEGPAKPPPAQQAEPPKPPTGQKPGQQNGQPQGQQTAQPQATIAVESNLVNLDVVVTDQEGNILTGLKKENFRILDDGQAQQVTNFAPSDAPITIVLLMEFSKQGYGYFAYHAQQWSAEFLNHLNDKDWVAFKTFSLHPTLEVDFTQNKAEVMQAISQLYMPGFSDSDLFDAVIETLDQMRDVKGKKSILVLASGMDTFSKHTLDQILRRLKETDVTIFCVGVGEDVENALDMSGRQGPIGRLSYLQGKNQLTTFGQLTGGYAWFPRFSGELPSIFNSVGALLRNQYTVGFTPSTPPDGKYHKLKVEVVDAQGNQLMVPDKKGHPKKVTVYARQGYASPNPSHTN